MPPLTFDGRSFIFDGKRVWIVSGSLHFQRLPRETWADRLHQAKRAGLNTIETPIFWNAIEPRPGSFDFTGDNDIKHFVKLAGEAGLFVILRPGPYIGEGWDLGGLPSWLAPMEDMHYRMRSAPFLEAVGRYFTALSKQIKSQQATTPGGGPILLIQTESNWTCGHDELALGYLGELTRYMREAGLSVPKINANNLWAGVEGDIDTWSGSGDMLAMLRQLAIVRPDQPRLISDFGFKARPAFGVDLPDAPEPVEVQRRLIEIIAGGGQFNINPFIGGTSLGFWAGQSSYGEHTFLASQQDAAAPVDEAGRPTPAFGPVRRAATFASCFSGLLANLNPTHQPIVLDPVGATRPSNSARPFGVGWSIVHAAGSQGSAVFLLSSDGKPKRGTVNLLLPDGQAMSVETGLQAAYWCVFDYNLSNQATLDASSLCVLWHSEKMLVAFGPGGRAGHITINGTPLHITVPKGKRPLVQVHEDITVVIVNEKTIDQTWPVDDAVFVGADGLDEQNEPILPARAKSCSRVAEGGTMTTYAPPGADAAVKHPRITLGEWHASPCGDYVDGSSPRFAQIPGPGDLAELGAPLGYGWYRVKMRFSKARRVHLAAPGSGDRLAMLLDGEPIGMLGRGAGAVRELPVSFKKGEHTMIVLADNMGRISGGSDMRDPKGLCDHLCHVTPFKVGRSKLVEEAPVELLGAFGVPLFWTRQGEQTHPLRLTWQFQHRKKAGIAVELPALPVRYAVLLNGEGKRFVDANRAVRFVMEQQHFGLNRGNNTLQIAFRIEDENPDSAEASVKEYAADVARQAVFAEVADALSEKSEWAFAKWELPGKTAYEPVTTTRSRPHIPTWWRSRFDMPDGGAGALFVDLTGMTKGQVFVNGHNLGRYFLTTNTRKKIGPIERMHLPAPYLKPKKNELVLFDEHGGDPTKTRLINEH